MDDGLHVVADGLDAPSMLTLTGIVLIWGVAACSAIVNFASLARWN